MPTVRRSSGNARTLRSDVLEALQAALQAANPQAILQTRLKLRDDVLKIDLLTYDLSRYGRIIVLGGGKASALMALALEKILGDRITGGVVNIPDYQKPKPETRIIQLQKARHPIPSQRGITGVEKMLRLIGKPSREDLAICLLSGGGSALMPMPAAAIKLQDKQKVTELLLRSGADINELNAVRKHLSAVKGGRLAEKLYPATVLSLIISDVVGDRFDSIASGPTAPDPTTYADADNVLRKYKLTNKTPQSVLRHLRDGTKGLVPETPKKGSKVFKRVHNLLIANNTQACDAASENLRKKGYQAEILSTRIEGETHRAATLLASKLRQAYNHQTRRSPPVALIAGGETTLKVRGRGLGGRNQELALVSAQRIRDLRNVVIASMGTDGIDGNTQAAGALADETTIDRAESLGLEAQRFLRNNDAYIFFHRLDDLIVTGPTGTAVSDIMIAAVGRQPE